MGTSVNQASPKTLNWHAVRAAYRDKGVPIPRVSAEIWRAALNQQIGNIAELIARPIVARLGELAATAKTNAEVSRTTALEIVRTKQSSLGTDIARRAAIQCVGASDRAAAYVEQVFSEVTAYLVSRDLPGFVGAGRMFTVDAATELKSALMSHAAQTARSVERPKRVTPETWARYVSDVVERLREFKP